MEYLVESHMGGYYISNLDPDIIERYCEQCGDYDRILLSWEDNKKEVLEKYFSKIKETKEEIQDDYNNGITRDEITDSLVYDYDNDRYIVQSLYRQNIISKEEKFSLLKQISLSQKQQFIIVKSIYEKKDTIKGPRLIRIIKE